MRPNSKEKLAKVLTLVGPYSWSSLWQIVPAQINLLAGIPGEVVRMPVHTAVNDQLGYDLMFDSSLWILPCGSVGSGMLAAAIGLRKKFAGYAHPPILMALRGIEWVKSDESRSLEAFFG